MILNAYRGVLRSIKSNRSKEETKFIRKAFNVASKAHQSMRRKSGEPYIFHPLAVARICADEIGLGPTSIVCALLHDTVEDTNITLNDIESNFGNKVRNIIDGLTKISGEFDFTSSTQAENFKKMFLTIPDDVRVILIKLADRLHNMRTLDSMKEIKKLKIASETAYLYAPLAHRLGLYSIKTEMEDLSFKFTYPKEYNLIKNKLEKTKAVRDRYIQKFSHPIKKELDKQGFRYKLKARTKSIPSIHRKMKDKGVDFEEVFDVFAIRIILDSPEEKADCWKVYSVVTDFYIPNPERLRDWISYPKQNGYESLHTTVMSPTGKWVEVQIRSRRMDDIAEKGLAAHWRYKEGTDKNTGFDKWISEIREIMENKDSNTSDFLDDFKTNLYSDEIYVFTPKGDLFTLPKNATALDFAFSVHTDVGISCIGAKVNSKLVPLSYVLKSGDQIEILTSKKQIPKEAWLDFVITSKAKSKIKQTLKEEKKKLAINGKEILERKLNALKLNFSENNLKIILKHYHFKEHTEFFFQIAQGTVDLSKIKEINHKSGQLYISSSITKSIKNTFESLVQRVRGNENEIIIGEGADPNLDYKLAPCCNPLPGDQVFGFITINDGIKIHRNNCPNARQLRANYAYRILAANWKDYKRDAFITGLKFIGIDNVGLVKELTTIISDLEKVNMKSLNFDSKDGVFEGNIMLYVYDKNHLENLIRKLRNIEGIEKVVRME
ncbi:MAG: bifunctional (p)ppGpp synthetase/guanosine-3',5'-bis(diphosphate) 3'-pyrophosphohydrolase [Bacteroidota bacterium]|nr:bifunctional (p)ppGpp synthetase/guanosine-3',5'-bis(diphosphate) 3'-pyrophosphohydrolase [Bacteroidota bacterium]MEC7618214.1 bifunctional (p)ppGpp synthetase/guanosine-3',5'-bis(diphosphate) 3'-pyrophosphohydrolase [Bacteroidota bacterium]MEC8005541.1 bifunctional (p)ppGpp synthetase/guanosine-3',5'-bis(diphosphate) 3'-pyrophosphohydrolase [Bacteroidota bacterium]